MIFALSSLCLPLAGAFHSCVIHKSKLVKIFPYKFINANIFYTQK